MAPGDWIVGALRRNHEQLFEYLIEYLEREIMTADKQMIAWMKCVEERLTDLETATGTERILHRAVKEVAQDYVHRRKFGEAPSLGAELPEPVLRPSRIPENLLDPGSWHDPSLKTVMRLMSHEVELHEKSDNDWKRGYVRAMTVVYGWLEDLLERRDDEGPEESGNASGR